MHRIITDLSLKPCSKINHTSSRCLDQSHTLNNFKLARIWLFSPLLLVSSCPFLSFPVSLHRSVAICYKLCDPMPRTRLSGAISAVIGRTFLTICLPETYWMPIISEHHCMYVFLDNRKEIKCTFNFHKNAMHKKAINGQIWYH